MYSRYGSYRYPQAHPEGCPTHPAYPGATAAIGGAGVRVLRALFNPRDTAGVHFRRDEVEGITLGEFT